ncbi:TPA: conjugal transfer protein TraD [Legionella pneumophila]|uniref:conjugal transfer protein TraD n=1 Tax=Legionella pneumophila TaxID=446 RepID=UPI0005194879|nr:conjugal transfer protein TraD [Legionella pneumophila]HAT1720514.1 conjugal transfer protein TraD [Legionella pneumophila]HAT1827467.1 conjugal transfer protein TraD [Legionella pneumophila]HAT2093848.1 conjugal transfer protein TraD [Legionella pneumophila]HAT9108512.1 conjugal transfer protein TraD [Legionella pneumophila subsp. pneumophila]HAU0184358.1 conjugal transfer protein TraD [Legionella pneumophila]
MAKHKQIEKEKQLIARCEKSLALEKLKKRKADTRRKIELGGLVIKSQMNMYSPSIILGALCYAVQLMDKNNSYKCLFGELGSQSLLIKNK